MSTTTRTSGQRKYLPVNSTQGDFTTITPVLASARRADITKPATLPDFYVNYVASTKPWWKIQELGPYRGARIQFFSSGADATTLPTVDTASNYRIWTVSPAFAASAKIPSPALDGLVAGEISGYCTGTFTSSTCVGSATDIVTAYERVADAITFTLCTSGSTPSGKASAYETGYSLGSASVYSPGDNTPAELIIPDFGDGVFGFIIEFDAVAGTTANNAIIQLTGGPRTR
jgi:hypothetical protein